MPVYDVVAWWEASLVWVGPQNDSYVAGLIMASDSLSACLQLLAGWSSSPPQFQLLRVEAVRAIVVPNHMESVDKNKSEMERVMPSVLNVVDNTEEI